MRPCARLGGYSLLENLILRWGYLILGLGTFLEGETILIAAGAMAHKGLLSQPLVIGVALLGAYCGDLLWYFIGRKYGYPFIQKRPKLLSRLAATQKLLDRYGILFVLSFRFIYGIRTVAPVLLGIVKYPFKRYAALNGLSAIVWSITFSYIGWGLGFGFRQIVDRHPRIEEIILIALITGFLLWLVEHAFGRAKNGSVPTREPRPSSDE